MIGLTIAAGVLAYPVIAGMVFRAKGAPQRCDGSGRPREFEDMPNWDPRQAPVYRCEGPWSIISHQYGCRGCWAHRIAVRDAWLWPIAWVAYVPRRLFNAGANISATPAPTETPTPAEALP